MGCKTKKTITLGADELGAKGLIKKVKADHSILYKDCENNGDLINYWVNETDHCIKFNGNDADLMKNEPLINDLIFL